MKTRILNFLWIPIGVASFFVYSSQFYPLLNSDDALNILMIKDLRLPLDLYAWGQDRGGTLIPLLGWPLHHLLGLSVVLSESIVHYLLLFIGFWCLSRFLKPGLSRLIFSLAWFFPAYWFFSLIRHPFGIQYALTGISLYLILLRRPEFGKGFKESLLVIVSILALSVALWVSDLAISNVLALILLVFFRLKEERVPISRILKKPELFITVLGIVVTALFLLYAKSSATKTEAYNQDVINTIPQIFESLSTLTLILWQIITFQKETFLLSIFGILSLVLIATLLIHRPIPGKKQKYFCLFILVDCIILFLIILLSHWAFLNGDSRRYFVGIYIGIVLLVLIHIENCVGLRRKLFQGFALITMMIAGFSGFHYLMTVYPKSLKPMINVVDEFTKLGEIGVIGEYWNSFITACPDPSKISATTHDGIQNPNPRLVDEVFSKPRLFIIKDMWLKEFPDTLMQYGFKLKRVGPAFKIGNCMVNEYERVLLHKIFYPDDLVYIKEQLVNDSVSNKSMVVADSMCQQCRTKHLIFGPGIELNKGRYHVNFFLRFDKIKEGMDLALLDVTADFGRTKLAKKVICASEAGNGNFQYYQIEFENLIPRKNMEFRLFFLRNSKVSFGHLVLDQY